MEIENKQADIVEVFNYHFPYTFTIDRIEGIAAGAKMVKVRFFYILKKAGKKVLFYSRLMVL